MNKIFKISYWVVTVSLLSAVASCGLNPFASDNNLNVEKVEYVKDPSNPARIVTKAQADKVGKLDIFNKTESEDGQEFQANKYLWDACLDILGTMPSLVVKPEFGFYETDYVTADKGLVKVRCRVTGAKILSENLDVITFEKSTADSPVKSFKDNVLKGQILLRARELRANNV